MQTVIIKKSKIKNQKSKIKNLFYLIIFVLANLYLSSCNQVDEGVFEEAETDNQTIVKEAQNWYQGNVESPSYASEAEANFRIFRPRWEKAQVLKLSNSKEKLIVVPLVRNLKVNYGTKGFIRKLLLQTDKNNKVIAVHIVEMIGEKQFLKQNENEILKNSQENQISNFTGAILWYDLSYTFLKGKFFKEGKTSSASLRIQNSEVVSDFNANASSGSNCIDWYLVTWWSDGSVTYDFLFTTCDDCNACIDSGGGSGGGQIGGDSNFYDRLCGNIDFRVNANAYVATMNGLGGYFVELGGIGGVRQAFNIELNSNCITIPFYGITEWEASEIFLDAFNLAIQDVQNLLNAGSISASYYSIRVTLLDKIKVNLRTLKPGSNFGHEACSGSDIPINQAEYCN